MPGSSRKKQISGKRGKAAQKKNARSSVLAVDRRGIGGILLFGIGLLALSCQFIPSAGGILNVLMLFVRGLGGRLCLLLPILLCVVGAFLAFGASEFLQKRTVVCGVVLFILVETMLQLTRSNNILASVHADGQAPGWLSFAARSYRLSSLECSGGGLIGALLAWPLYRAFDIWGGLIILGIALVVTLMIATGMSFGPAGAQISEWADDFRVRFSERLQGMRDDREQRAEQRLEEREARMREAEERRQEEERRRAEKKAEAEQARRIRTETESVVQKAKPQRAPEPAQPEEVFPPLRTEEKPAPAAPETPAMAVLPRIREDLPLYIEERGEEKKTAEGMPEFARVDAREAENAFWNGYRGEPVETEAGAQAGPSARETPFARPDEPAEDGPAPEQAYPGTMRLVRPEPEAEDAGRARPWPDDGAAEARPGPYEEQAEPETRPDPESRPEWQDGEEEPEQAPEDAGPGRTGPVFAQDPPDLPAEEPEESISAEAGVFAPETPPEQRRSARRRRVHTSPAGQETPEPARPAARPAQEPEEQPEKTIAALREKRLDATPMIRPQKEKHESPEARPGYEKPPISLLKQSRAQYDPEREAYDLANGKKLIETLESFGVKAQLRNYTHGPAITRFEIQPAPGVKVSRITTLADDIALNLAADGVRIEAPVPGKPVVGIEVPNRKIEMVCLRDVLASPEMRRETSPTAVALGKSISGSPVIADMAKMPHVLIAGATGSGKSVCINTIIQSILFRATPEEVRLILIDPKVVELSVYNGVPHLLIPVVTDPKKASAALSWAVVEMEHRYKQFETMRVRDIKGYNAAIGPDEKKMPKIIVIIDELADLMMVAPGEVEESICRLAQLARAAGIHLVIATQRPSVNVITGVIKANIPSRIAFAVSSQIDSRTILDGSGAEKLLGKGDMLYAPQGAGKPTRVQGCFVSDDEVQEIVNYIKEQSKETHQYDQEIIEQIESAGSEDKQADPDGAGGPDMSDEMLIKAVDLAIDAGQVSISMLQRRLRVGYARAGRLVDEMTQMGITGEAEGPTKPRKVLITREEWSQKKQEMGA